MVQAGGKNPRLSSSQNHLWCEKVQQRCQKLFTDQGEAFLVLVT
jgi:hypothetical protein